MPTGSAIQPTTAATPETSPAQPSRPEPSISASGLGTVLTTSPVVEPYEGGAVRLSDAGFQILIAEMLGVVGIGLGW